MAKQEQLQVDFTQVINELANRLRILEGKQSLFSEKMLVMNQNMIAEYKELKQEIKNVHAKIKTVEEDIANVKNVVRHLSDEAAKFAREDRLRRLEKYVELWDPLKFTTEKEVLKLIEQSKHHKRSKLKKHKIRKKKKRKKSRK